MRYLHPHKNSKKITLCLEVNGEDCSFHISAASDLYGDAYRLRIGDEVNFSASQISEKTYNLVTLVKQNAFSSRST